MLENLSWGFVSILEVEVFPLLGGLVLGQLEERRPHTGQGGAGEGGDGAHILGFMLPPRGNLELELEDAAVEHDVDDVGELEVPRGRPPFDPLDHGLHLI